MTKTMDELTNVDWLASNEDWRNNIRKYQPALYERISKPPLEQAAPSITPTQNSDSPRDVANKPAVSPQRASIPSSATSPATLHGDTEAAAFLKTRPHKSHTLTAIPVDPVTHEKLSKQIETKSFVPGDLSGIDKWAAARPNANQYWSVNPLRNPKDCKSNKGDIEKVVTLHVDVDCPDGEDQVAFVERMMERVSALTPTPTFIIGSGGGLQLFWDLIESDYIILSGAGDADPAVIEAEALTRGIATEVERVLGVKPDATHNVDRIMRLPGSDNKPDKKKIAKGRKPARAKVLMWDGQRYPRSAFTPLAATGSQRPAASNPEGQRDHYSFNPSGKYEQIPIDDVRLAKLPQSMKDLAFHGDVAGKYKGDRSRAAIGFATACWRADVPEDVIASMLMTLPIGECIREKKNVERELKRTIERGHEFADDPLLSEMNEKHHVVNHGGKARVLTWTENELGYTVPSYSSFSDFKALRNKDKVEVKYKDAKGKLKTELVGAGDWWIDQRKRAQYEGLVYAPNIDERELSGDRLNLWRGWPVAAHEGDCGLYLAHLRDNVCQGNEEHYNYLVGWMAYAVQHPERQGEVAIALRGLKGVGKTVMAEEFGKLFGNHFKTVVNPDHLTGKFNAHLQNCSVLFADECFFAGDRRHENILKGLVTGNTIFIEPKGVDSYEVKNYLHLILATNSKWVVPASSDERRWFVLDVGAENIQDQKYFNAITAQMNNSGRAALLHMLRGLDVRNFNVRKAPRTKALRDQIARTRSGVDALVEKVCSEGEVPCAHHMHRNYTVAGDEVDGFDRFIARHEDSNLRLLGPLRVKRELAKDWGCFIGSAARLREGAKRLSGIQWPSLNDLRAKFIDKHGPQEWLNPEAEDWASSEEEDIAGYDEHLGSQRVMNFYKGG